MCNTQIGICDTVMDFIRHVFVKIFVAFFIILIFSNKNYQYVGLMDWILTKDNAKLSLKIMNFACGTILFLTGTLYELFI